MHIRYSHLAYGALLATIGTLTTVGSLSSCASKPTVEVELTDPNDLRPGAEYTQLVVFDGGCPPDEDLAYGRIKGARYVQTTGVDGPFNEIGDLDKASYGFAALLRRADCAVVAFGCTPVNLDHHRRITIQVEPVSPPLGACDTTKGESCNNGVCSTSAPAEGGTPGDGGGEAAATDAGDASTAKQCTMEVLSGSTKEFAPSIANASLIGPVAMATDTGFMVTYLEWNADSTQLVRVPVDATGAAGTRVTEPLTQCGTAAPAPGITAAFNTVGGTGFTGVTWDDCPGDAGPDKKLLISGFDAKGAVLSTAQYFKTPKDISRFQAMNGSVAKPSDPSFLMATLEGGLPKMYTWDGVNVAPATDVAETFSTSPSSFVRVTETASIVGVVAEVNTIPQFWVGKPNTSLFGEPLQASKIATVASWGDRALAAVVIGTGISWMVRSADGNPVKNANITGGPFQSLGAVALHDSVAIIAAQAKGLKVYRFDNATGAFPLQPAESVLNLGTSLATFEGTLMSVAGSGNRVLITWLNNAGPQGEGKSPGGYVLLKCDG